MEYKFRDIEKKWQQQWQESGIYQVSNDSSRPKCYVLDMFPYPSGAGLHVGHPLGYIASDIYSRYKRLKGFNVLHPMGYDAFGLPAEQYAIDHGIHPAISTEQNINNFRRQLDNIGFSYDWSREIRTSDPRYYKWTQWIFLKLFGSFYNRHTHKAESIDVLIKDFEKQGNTNHPIPNSQFLIPNSQLTTFTSDEWRAFGEKQKMDILMEYRLAYCGIGEVNWCEALGTVLANDEVINGVSERGGYPVVKKKLRQWYLRITEYADRLLEGLDKVDFSPAMKEMQSNWIGKSMGAEIDFSIGNSRPTTSNQQPATNNLRVYTTRPDTIFGVDFMVLAPEHELVERITTKEQQKAVEEYIAYVKSRSERERMAEKKITGVFTGAYAVNPLSGREIPVWISEYVLAGYGTGAIMGVPCGDERDHKFARYFGIPITNIIGDYYNGEEANPTYDAKLQNSDFLDGIEMRKAAEMVISHLELAGLGKRKVNYKMRDAAFSRQRYWGEPFPIIWKDGIAYPLDEKELPVVLPPMEEIKPGPEGEGPLANLKEWVNPPSPEGEGSGVRRKVRREVNTMPGYAGSSWYFLRFMDPHNDKEFCNRKTSDYWNQVDLYIGGTEHAVGHLLYSRMWTKVLFDLGLIGHDEPYKRLVNQGMITSIGYYVKYLNFKTANGTTIRWLGNDEDVRKRVRLITDTHGAVFIEDDYSKDSFFFRLPYAGEFLDEKNRMTRKAYHAYEKKYPGTKTNENSFIWVDSDSGSEYDYFTVALVNEKMSKSKYNTYNPDDIVEKYGADTFRMYEMFLGPVEMSKPWDTKGIEGVHRFLKKFWRLFYGESNSPSSGGGRGEVILNDEQPTEAEWKVLHRAIKKIEDDTERFSFNTAVSAFMIATNELTELGTHKRAILEPLLILLAPYAPHITEELWHQLGNSNSIADAAYPKAEEKYLTESSKEYPISVNGKLRTTINIDLGAAQPQVEEIVLGNPVIQKWLEGRQPKKIIYVKGKMVNVVV